MPLFVVPSSGSEDDAPSRLREHNDCHDPHSGQFASKGAGVCSGVLTASQTTPTGPKALRSLVERDPDFDIDAALDAGGPGFRKQYADLQQKVPEAQNNMMTRMTRVMSDVGAHHVVYTQLWEGEGPRVTVAPPKGARRMIEKAALDYDGDLSQVKDAVRAAIAVDSPNDVPRVARAIRSQFKVVREKNRFDQPINGGYRDMLFNVRLKGGLVGEVQVHVKPMLKAKETVGHKLYTEMRRYAAMTGDAAREAYNRLEAQSFGLYSSAWSIALAAMTTAHGLRVTK